MHRSCQQLLRWLRSERSEVLETTLVIGGFETGSYLALLNHL